MLLPFLFLLAGFVLLGVGAEVLVRGASRLAFAVGVSPLIVGLTIVAFGTSAPELAVSVQSSASGNSALALGNVIGSNIANIGLILGITAVIHPISIEQKLIRQQMPMVIAASLLMAVLLWDRVIDFSDGLFLTCGLVAYLVVNYLQANDQFEADELSINPGEPSTTLADTGLNLGYIVTGIIILVFGSRVFVDNAITIAHLFGVSEAIIGLTLVAVGTSIPELATSMVAALRRESDIAIGNVVGSNLFNILCVLGVTALIASVSGDQFTLADLVVMILFTLILLPMARSNLTVSRTEGLFLLCGYGVYLIFVAQQA